MSYVAERRQEEKDRRRAEIIDAAIEVYREIDWDGVSADCFCLLFLPTVSADCFCFASPSSPLHTYPCLPFSLLNTLLDSFILYGLYIGQKYWHLNYRNLVTHSISHHSLIAAQEAARRLDSTPRCPSCIRQLTPGSPV